MSDPPIPDRVKGFLSRFAHIVARLVNAQSVYGQVERLPQGTKGVAGAAVPGTGTLRVGRQVPELLDSMLQTFGSRPSLEKLRGTIDTLTHEFIHLSMDGGRDRDPWTVTSHAPPPSRETLVFLEEGVTEGTTENLLPRVLKSLENLAPGISARVPEPGRVYPNYVPATREVVKTVQALPEMRDRDVLIELAGVGPRRKIDLLVEQAMEGFGLTYNVPFRERGDVRGRIRGALESHVKRNRDWMVPRDPSRPGKLATNEPAALSTIMGRQMSMELWRQLYAEGERAGMALPDDWRQQFAERELRMALNAKDERRFGGPESQVAIQHWLAEASARGVATAPSLGPSADAGVTAPTPPIAGRAPALGERWVRDLGVRRSQHGRRRIERHHGGGLAR